MNICVFGSASGEIHQKYITATEEMCETLAKNGHNLVFGAGMHGLMGAAARGFKRGGGRITGVIPHFFREETIETIYDQCDELIFTDTMRERKQKMEDLAEAFLITPGGIGTFEELFEVMTLKQLGRHKLPIAFYNIDGYYSHLMAAMERSAKEGFIRENVHDLYICTESAEEVISYLENSAPSEYKVKDLKNG